MLCLLFNSLLMSQVQPNASKWILCSGYLIKVFIRLLRQPPVICRWVSLDFRELFSTKLKLKHLGNVFSNLVNYRLVTVMTIHWPLAPVPFIVLTLWWGWNALMLMGLRNSSFRLHLEQLHRLQVISLFTWALCTGALRKEYVQQVFLTFKYLQHCALILVQMGLIQIVHYIYVHHVVTLA